MVVRNSSRWERLHENESLNNDQMERSEYRYYNVDGDQTQAYLWPVVLREIMTPCHGYFKNLLLALTGKLDAHHDPLWDHGHIKFWSVPTLPPPCCRKSVSRTSDSPLPAASPFLPRA
jgi:hypothetical protein